MKEGQPIYQVLVERNPTPDDWWFWQVAPDWLRTRVWFLQAVISSGWEPMTLEWAEKAAKRERQDLPPGRRVRLKQVGVLRPCLDLTDLQ
jgi:hypothetical protein